MFLFTCLTLIWISILEIPRWIFFSWTGCKDSLKWKFFFFLVVYDVGLFSRWFNQVYYYLVVYRCMPAKIYQRCILLWHWNVVSILCFSNGRKCRVYITGLGISYRKDISWDKVLVYKTVGEGKVGGLDERISIEQVCSLLLVA